MNRPTVKVATIKVPQVKAVPKPPQAPAAKVAEPKPSGLPKPPPVAEKSSNPLLDVAKKAVETFNNEKRVLLEMRDDWEKNYPEADQAWQDISQQEDLVTAAVAKAKPLAAAAKQTVGDFVVTRKWSAPLYDPKQLADILGAMSAEDRGEALEEMFSSGIVEAVLTNKEATLAWMAQRPAMSKKFQKAFKDREEMTPAVTVPKF